MNIIFLLLGCIIVFVRPVWGLPILVVVTSTLFHLSQYMSVPLPVGYISPIEAILFVLFLRLYLDKRSRSKKQLAIQADANTIEQEAMVKRVLLSAIIPYVLWQSFTIFLGLFSADSEHFRFGLRFFLNGVIPWIIIWIMWQLRHYKDKIFFAVALITIITAISHIVIQLADYRPVMPLAYWSSASEEYMFVYESRIQRLVYEEIVRALPQGIMLILFFSVYYFSKYTIETRPKKTSLIFSIVCLMALTITFTRSLLFSALCGFFITMLLVFYYRAYFPPKLRAIRWMAVTTLVAIIYISAFPPALDYWQERFTKLTTGADAKVFSEENPARGLDNIASINAISDSPFWGYGSPRYHSRYSMRLIPATDIHPLLQIGLVGGIPAIFLFIRLLFLVIWKIGLSMVGDRQQITRILPFTSILIMTTVIVNTIGAGGTTDGRGLIAMTLMIGFLAVYYPSYTQPKKGQIPSNRSTL